MKLYGIAASAGVRQVAPRRGAWIETSDPEKLINMLFCRTPQGCVD